MKRIVVGVDGSEEARLALHWGLCEARLHGSELMVTHVWQPLDLVAPARTLSDPALDFQSDLEKGASRVLDTARAELGDDLDGVDVHTQLLDGSIAGSLVQVATGAELLVVGSRGWGGVRGLLLGSVSQQCAHHAPCPLMVVRRNAVAHGDERNTIVVGVDGSPSSEAALHWALAEAERRRGEVLALHAWSFPATASIGYPSTTVDGIRQAATTTLEDVVRRASGRYHGVPCEQVVANGSAAQVLVEAAERAALLVVGTRGRGGFAGLLLGSVSQQCAHHAPCPIVIVPQR